MSKVFIQRAMLVAPIFMLGISQPTYDINDLDIS